jgi:hypothetical protein
VNDKSRLLCTIFKSSREQALYVFVPKAEGENNIPEELRQRMGECLQVMTLIITPDKKLARADATEVINSILEKGYYLQLPPEITSQVLHDGD